MADIAAILLAAGRSSRFREGGGAEPSKLVADLHGKPLVRHAAEAALASRATPLIVVTGFAREAVEAALAGLPARFAHNADYATGMASSLKAGLAAAPAESKGALIMLADMPSVRPALIDRLIDAFLARPDVAVAAPVVSGQRGNPVILSRRLFAAASALEGDEGARRIIAGIDAARVALVEDADGGSALDIDTRAALAAAREL
jgi:molybdenum cofactor cytidylyltransferase